MRKSIRKPSLALLVLSALQSMAGEVTEFTQAEVKKHDWRVVNDGVMGGFSQGKMVVTQEGVLQFSGTLSLENNGGFSSIRTGNVPLDLSASEGVLLRVKGGGRKFQMRFNTDARFRGREVSFSAEFPTEKGKWTELKVPFTSFQGSFRGMKLPDEKFDPAKIQRMGILLADKQPGEFELQVDWIRSY